MNQPQKIRISEILSKELADETPANLYHKITSLIERKKRQKAIFRAVFSGLACAVSLIAIVPVFQYASQEFARTGFLQYFSLIFSDGGTALTCWKEFGLSLGESVPIFGLTLFLGTIYVLLKAIKILIENSRRVFYRFA